MHEIFDQWSTLKQQTLVSLAWSLRIALKRSRKSGESRQSTKQGTWPSEIADLHQLWTSYN